MMYDCSVSLQVACHSKNPHTYTAVYSARLSLTAAAAAWQVASQETKPPILILTQARLCSGPELPTVKFGPRLFRSVSH